MIYEDATRKKKVYDWKKEILGKIEDLLQYIGVQNIYLCKNNEYSKFLK